MATEQASGAQPGVASGSDWVSALGRTSRAIPTAGNAVVPAPTVTVGDISRESVKRRPRGWIVATSVLTVALIGVAVFAGVTYGNASSWKSRATKTQAQLLGTRRLLHSSEADARQLQGRVDGLASEKAAVEDQKTVVERVAVLAATAAQDGQDCRTATNTFVTAMVDSLSSLYASSAGVEALATNADTVCNRSVASYNAFADAVRSL